MELVYNPVVQRLLSLNGVQVDVLRLDLIHPQVSGNKWFKLKYNLARAIAEKKSGILTFGGAHSNHVASTAAACSMSGLRSMAFIRGDGDAELTPTLSFATSKGMELHFLSRENYRQKNTAEYANQLRDLYPDYLIVPEGGANREGILGCADILTPDLTHDLVFCGCGTAATFTGLVLSSKPHQAVIGVNILKGNNSLVAEANRNLSDLGSFIRVAGNDAVERSPLMHCMTDLFAFKGYATFNQELIDFKRSFEKEHKILLDHVYTVKVFYGALTWISTGKVPAGSRVLIVHTGGLQGNEAFEKRYVSLLS